MRGAMAVVIVLMAAVACRAHDTWVETNTNLIRTGDAIHVDLKLGNHGNEHRDFKLASKVKLEHVTVDVIAPGGEKYDIRERLVDTGYTPTEGYWTGKFVAGAPGLHIVAHAQDAIVNHGRPVRSHKSGKVFFVASPSLDKVQREQPGFDTPLGHPLEIVPLSNPVTPMGPGIEFKVQLLLDGSPLVDARVSFIPRSDPLTREFDERYEALTDRNGTASFTPRMGDVYLIAAHHRAPDESGEGYELTQYSATLTLFVPELCPCCVE
jgi:uncharacterized GH25 family protein